MKLNIIHLPNRKDRESSMLKQLLWQEITDYKIWPGIIHEKPVTGICRAFKQIVQSAKDNNEIMCCIGEDDLSFTSKDSWKYFLDNIPGYFDMYLASFYSGLITFNNRIEKYRGNSLIIVHSKFYDKFLSVREDINIDNALDNLGEYFVSPMFCCIQTPGFSDNVGKEVNYSDRIPEHKLFKGYEE